MQRRIIEFLEYLENEKECSENTISAYRNDLTQFLNFTQDDISSWQEIDKRHLSAYVKHLRGKKYASSTVARKVAAVKSFFHFLLDHQLLEDDPTATLDSPKVKKRLPKILSFEEIETLLSQPDQSRDPKSLRDTMDQLKDKVGSGIVLLATETDGKVSLVAGVTKDLTNRFKAGDLVKAAAEKVGGRGGGRPDMAQAGGNDPSGIPAALQLVNDWVQARG